RSTVPTGPRTPTGPPLRLPRPDRSGCRFPWWPTRTTGSPQQSWRRRTRHTWLRPTAPTAAPDAAWLSPGFGTRGPWERTPVDVYRAVPGLGFACVTLQHFPDFGVQRHRFVRRQRQPEITQVDRLEPLLRPGIVL